MGGPHMRSARTGSRRLGQRWRLSATLLSLLVYFATRVIAQTFSSTLGADVIPGGRPTVAGVAPDFSQAETAGCTVLSHITQTSSIHSQARADLAGMKLAMDDIEFLVDADLVKERHYAIVLGTTANSACVSTTVFVDTDTCGQYYILRGSWSSLSGCGWAVDVNQVATSILYLYWEDAGNPGGVVGTPISMKLSNDNTVSYTPNSFNITALSLSMVQQVNSSGFVENRARMSFTYELVEHYPLNYSFTGMVQPDGWTEQAVQASIREVDCGLFDPTISTLCTVRRTVSTLVPKGVCNLGGTFELDFTSQIMDDATGFTAADYNGHSIRVSVPIAPAIDICSRSLSLFSTNASVGAHFIPAKTQYNFHDVTSYGATLPGIAATTAAAAPSLWQLTVVSVPDMNRWDLVQSGVRSSFGRLANVATDDPVVSQNSTLMTVLFQSFGGTTRADGMVLASDGGSTLTFNVLATFRATTGTITLAQGGTVTMTSAISNGKMVTVVMTTPAQILITNEIGPMIGQIQVAVPASLNPGLLDAAATVSSGVGSPLTNSRLPVWAIALIAVGGVAVLVGVSLVVFRQRIRRLTQFSYKSTGPLGSATRAGSFNAWRLRRGGSQMEENELSSGKRDAVGGFVKISDDKMVTFGSWRGSKKGGGTPKAAPSVLNSSFGKR
ncbi:hypothetical protein M427DRAFT_255742 [Gonapodya prolifera JEL478]|uniref:Uncharacterized protein n=1 Tax=Gonapodya prolifera (strain JEL478) TaxID=1344416 RepID=A0A139AMH3_GONPJ|nr:hypothetical protein M427DRAFT_255742 [Gonapodya prolifera JEL478]|eukprot:KXS17645.1 hypothetical protein M427DRAFT_255742 [Gonapodya prolifera JEL478]